MSLLPSSQEYLESSFNSNELHETQCKLVGKNTKSRFYLRIKIKANGNRNNTGLPKVILQSPRKANSYWTKMGGAVMKIYYTYLVARKYDLIYREMHSSVRMKQAQHKTLMGQFSSSKKHFVLCAVQFWHTNMHDNYLVTLSNCNGILYFNPSLIK